jgi:hypothetical protein
MAYNTSHLFELSTTEVKVLFDLLGPAIKEETVMLEAGDTRIETAIKSNVGTLILTKCLLAMRNQPEFSHSSEWIESCITNATEGGWITESGIPQSIEALVAED